jgi:hypothetical protein
MPKLILSAQAKPSTTKCVFASVLVVLGSLSAFAQQVAPANQPVTVVKPPMVRQIEPMVAPVKRIAPKTMPMPQFAAPASVALPSTPPTIASAPDPKPAVPALAAGLAGVTVAPTVVAQAKSLAQKVVVHTCKIGQDYSDKLKSCVTPSIVKSGVTKVASATSKVARKRPALNTEGATRSALGAKRKP